MRLLAPIAPIISTLLDLACGSRCAGCGCRAGGSSCAGCRRELELLARPQDAAFLDEGAAARMVRVAKHGHWRGGATFFATFLIDRAAIPQVDVVTWVPADPSRRARRGGCLPERLARRIARQLDVPCLALLERHVHGSQRGLDRAARRVRAAGSYRARPACASLARGQRVLLLDDVRTTGATLDACSRELTAHALQVESRAIVGVGAATPNRTARDRSGFGVAQRERRRRGIAATSAEFPLTTARHPADTMRHDR